MSASDRLRLWRMDILRAAAAFGVVVMHVAGRLVTDQRDIHSGVWWTWILWDSAVLWCVPAFVMLSGAVLLGNESGEDWRAFYRKRARRLLVPLASWTALYSVLRWTTGAGDRSWKDIALGILDGAPYPHMWFLYMLAALAVFTPMLRTYVRAAPAAERRILVAALLALTAANSAATRLLEPGHRLTALNQYAAFLGYYLCGYELRRADLGRVAPAALLAAVGASYAAIVLAPFALLTWAPRVRGVFFLSCYQSPAVMAASIGLFAMVCRAGAAGGGPGRIARLVAERVAPCAYGVYLAHPLAWKAMRVIGPAEETVLSALAVPGAAAVVFAVSLAATMALLRVPYARRTVS
jgi:surface polysaccharide O-acyltransferase-like enzyme